MVLHRAWLTMGLLVLVVASCHKATDETAQRNSEAKQTDPKLQNQPADQLPADPFPGPADLKLTADELGKEQNKNEKAAQAKYKGKVIELTGMVRSIGKKTAGLEPSITLRVKDEIVQLYLVVTEPRPWDKVSPGQGVKLKVGYLNQPFGIELVGGPILEVTGTANPTLTAEELAKAYEADPVAARKKYGDLNADGLVLTGEITEATEFNANSVPEFFLKTGTKLKLSCGPDQDSARGLKAGMKVKLTGVCFGLGSGNEKNQIRIVDCVVIGVLK